jgi:CRP/FNR family transcriptional regulator
MEDPDLELLDKIIKRRLPASPGQHLFQTDTPFEAIYAVRSGSVISYVTKKDGSEQITGFYLPGELVGLEAINTGYNRSNARTLETSSFCVIPYDQLEELADQVPGLRRQLVRVLSKEIKNDHEHLMLLGKQSSEERLAALLLSFSTRFEQRGFSGCEYHLCMTRNDISNYLGLAVETVCRTFTRFQDKGILTVKRKHVRLHDIGKLKLIAGM